MWYLKDKKGIVSVSFLVFSVATIFLMMSCKGSRSVIKKPLKEAGAHYLMDELKANELKFEWFSAKYNAEQVFNKKKTSFKGQIRIYRDSLIWISVSPALGIEMARLMITTDSIKLINRFESNYFISDMRYVNNLLNHALDYDMLQAFITGNDFSFYEDGRFRATVDDDEYKLITTGRHKLKKYVKENEEGNVIPIQNIWLDPENYKITMVLIKEIIDENRKFVATYSDFELFEEQLFPTNAEYDIESLEKKMILSVKFSKVSINKPLKFPFKIPEKYERVY